MDNITTGKYGENLATEFLMKKGYRILERNFKKPWGELDIIAEHGSDIIFIEVKTQNKDNRFFIKPEENITPFKKKQLIKSAGGYLAFKRRLDNKWRIDVIAVELSVGGISDIRHIENAVTE
ncbi:hypothetical protein A2907_02815 [Candidatus Azambacteria bacterium RIFCSPLOWO2_01_FULL_37_9]|uniref:UPF0102 protein A2907_02815 n=1 Tax=Candidatus Azambacteria bacterium RIFCSPLOWO2_01_FULL_37_9 TaxID=1797297 RepID=A0A1F5C6I1_9BACT|nr:MAG: hypothetical protein A2907_02815 [Candidatus Azambacteria bacterium RIFCSPLOWO2_01_FULL_37_9]